METAPLTLAHAHARKASHETAKQKLDIAAVEHESAAEEFARAAEATDDGEALRMLKLLEEHHHRLADIIKTRNIISKQLAEAGEPVLQKTDTTEYTASAGTNASSSGADASAQSHRSSGSAFAKAQQNRRDSSPALAKDMASRRGIPQPQPHPIKISQPVASTPSHSDVPRRKASSKQREVIELSPESSTAKLDQKASLAEDGFSRFYSNLTSGPFSKISSMLAFAALPLTEPTSQPSSPTSSRSEKTSARAHNEPDLSKLISPAAMNALEENQRRKGHSGQVFGPGESFYVVPTSGGTASYANVMRMDQRYARRQQGNLSNIEEDGEFVDARETQNPKTSGSGSISQVRAGGAGTFSQDHRAEELELENDTLKQVLDQMSHRLRAFERSAQDASMAALTQSMASVRTAGGGGGGGGGRHDESDRERAMEDELQRAVREISKLKGQNQKYKDYLERLKDSARQRDRVKKERGDNGA